MLPSPVELNTRFQKVVGKETETSGCQGFKNNQEMAVNSMMMHWENADFWPLIFNSFGT